MTPDEQLTLDPAAALFVPKSRFGRYALLSRLGESRLGYVYLARLSTIAGFEKHVVLKILHPALARDDRTARLFLTEAHDAGKVQHANVCEVRDVGQAEGTYYIVYEQLTGVPLTSVIRRIRRARDGRDLRLAAAIAEQACEGLHAAHEQGVIHKDLSPERLFVTAEGVIKVLGLGTPAQDEMIRRTGPGTIRFGYASPEQIRGEKINRRSNVFSMGAILFELMTGRRLFARDTEYLLARAITEEPIPEAAKARPAMPEGVSSSLRQALQRDPGERLPTARALGEALGQAVRPLGGPLYAAAVAEELERLCADEIFARVAPLRRAAEAEEHRTERLATAEEKIVSSAMRERWRRLGVPAMIFLASFLGALLTWLAVR
jgi:eukaryotic-like serine/threonine-protein kinase